MSPFLVPILNRSFQYMQFTIGVGVNNNHFEYWSSNYLGYTQCLTPVLVPFTYFAPKNVTNLMFKWGRGVLNFLDEGLERLENKGLATGENKGLALKNVQCGYLSPTAPPPQY
jgi:hypothetical protein